MTRRARVPGTAPRRLAEARAREEAHRERLAVLVETPERTMRDAYELTLERVNRELDEANLYMEFTDAMLALWRYTDASSHDYDLSEAARLLLRAAVAASALHEARGGDPVDLATLPAVVADIADPPTVPEGEALTS